MSTSAPQKMDQILGLSQIVYHSSPTGCLQVGVELRDKDVPWTLVLVSSLYLKKSCYKNGERQNQCLIFSPLFVNWPNKSWRPSNLPKTVTDESFLSIIMNSWLFVRLIVATVANFLTLSLSEAGLLLGLQPLLRWLWVDEGWGSPRCQQCSNKQEGGEGGEGGVRKLQGESVSRRTDWPAVSCCPRAAIDLATGRSPVISVRWMLRRKACEEGRPIRVGLGTTGRKRIVMNGYR